MTTTTTNLQITKQYKIVNEGVMYPKLCIEHNGQTLLHSSSHSGWTMRNARVEVKHPNKTEAALLTTNPRSIGGAGTMTIILPSGSPAKNQTSSTPQSIPYSWNRLSKTHFTLVMPTRTLSWIRTREKELGAVGRLGNRDYKLVDEQNGELLAVWDNNYAMFSRNPEAFINFYGEQRLDREMELVCLTAILGIEYGLRRETRTMAASASAAV